MKRIALSSPPAWISSGKVEDRFADMVERLQREASKNPFIYKRQVIGGALLGYAVVFGLLAILVVGTLWCLKALFTGFASLAVFKIGLVLGLTAWLVGRSLLVKIEPPSGFVIGQGEAPELERLVESVRNAAGGPRMHHLLITNDFNAAIVQHPRFGLFGWHENYLILGLPLLQALPVRSVEAIVAHEFGHLVNADGKLSTWIYRARQSWAQLALNLEATSRGWILRRFLNWYGPWFNALSFGLARQTEYAADAVSARVTTPDVAGQALMQVAVEGDRYHAEHWPKVWRDSAETQDKTKPFASAAAFFMTHPDTISVQNSLTRHLREITTLSDTHPCLADRLAALGVEPHLKTTNHISAADRLLPHGGQRAAAEFDWDWWEGSADHWQDQRAQRKQGLERLAALEAQPSESLDADARFKVAELTEWLRGPELALPLYSTIAWDRGEMRARFAVARLQLESGSSVALRSLLDLYPEMPSAADRQTVAALGLDWINRNCPDHQLARTFAEHLSSADQHLQQIGQELDSLDENTPLTALPKDSAIASDIARIADANDFVKAVWVGQAVVSADRSITRYVLLFKASTNDAAKVGLLMDQFLAVLTQHGPAMALADNWERRWLHKRLDAMKGGNVYRKPMFGGLFQKR